MRLLKERDELKAALLEFERHMEDIQSNVKGLSSERDHFKKMFKQVSYRKLLFHKLDISFSFTLLNNLMYCSLRLKRT